MENRTKIEVKEQNEVFFEAVIKHKTKDIQKVLTNKNLEWLQSNIDVWMKCGNYELVSADKVERVMCKLIA